MPGAGIERPWQGGALAEPPACPDTEWAFRRYEEVRARLPGAGFPAGSLEAANLAAVADRYEGFVLDAYGVLNVGGRAIPGAVARMAELRRRGRRLVVLTNAASHTRAEAIAKYHRLGFDFAPSEVVSSRDVAGAALAALAPGALWGAVSAAGDDFHDLPVRVADLIAEPARLADCDGILLLSTARWPTGMTLRLAEALARRPRPLVVANPDLVAPQEGGLSVEPGAHAHALADHLGLAPSFFGKPYPAAFAAALDRLGLADPAAAAMVGDTLHTDVLGGRAAGLGTVLVTRHGLFAGQPVAPAIAASGIVPDVIVPTT